MSYYWQQYGFSRTHKSGASVILSYQKWTAMNLQDWLVHRFPTAKRQTLKRMIEAGRVIVDGKPARTLRQELPDGVSVQLDQRPRHGSDSPDISRLRSQLSIAFEDADLLVINKPAGLLTSTVPKEKRATALAAVRRYLVLTDPKARIGLIHRLDRDASGLLVFSKSHLAYESLKTQFFKHTVTRIYTAIVCGAPTPPAGTIESHLVERADGTVYSTPRRGQGQPAVTHYQTIDQANGQSKLQVTLMTGRKHQIRVHLSERGAPIVGDGVYGQTDKGGLRLAATTLEFDHPRTGKRVKFQIAPPWE
jgi:23S rRNA pseudouridine1911/1915/1917 synthase